MTSVADGAGAAGRQDGDGRSRDGHRGPVVVDASAAVPLLVDRPDETPGVHALLANLDGDLVAPHVIDLEVASVLRWHVRSGELAADAAKRAVDDLAALRLARYPHDVLLPRIWGLRDNLTAYDAAYVALAEALAAPLVTRDTRIAGAPGHDARVWLAA